MTDRSSWNMSRIASHRALPRKRKVHAPVGRKQIDAQSCKACGYHVCSCARPQARKPAESTGIVWEDHPPKPSTDATAFRRVGSTDICMKHLGRQHECDCSDGFYRDLATKQGKEIRLSAEQQAALERLQANHAAKHQRTQHLSGTDSRKQLDSYRERSRARIRDFGRLVGEEHQYNFPIRVSLEDGRLPSQIQLERDARGCHAFACTCPECTYG